MKLFELIKKNEIKRLSCDIDLEISGLACKIDEVEKGYAFFCFVGSATDSHTLAAEAVCRGAAVVICERETDADCYVVTKDSRALMAKAAHRFYGKCIDRMRLVTVVGTNGKTTTTHMLSEIFTAAGYKTGLIGTCGVKVGGVTFENGMTTPDPIDLHRIFRDMYEAGVEVVVMEVSAHAIALKKMQGTTADCAVFTNFTQDHLDFFKTMACYRRTKKSYFHPHFMRLAIVNRDDGLGCEIEKSFRGRTVTYAVKNKADFMALNVEVTAEKSEYILSSGDVMREAEYSFSGFFNVYNTLGALTAASCLGVDMDVALKALSRMQPVDGRFNMMKTCRGSRVIIDYAHTPDGLENVLKSAREITDGKLICVFGCGGNRDRTKRPVMGKIASELSDLVVITSDNPRGENPDDIITDIEQGIKKDCYYIAKTSRSDAIRYALTFAACSDTVVIAGKGHENYQEISGKKHHFSDTEEVEKFTSDKSTRSE